MDLASPSLMDVESGDMDRPRICVDFNEMVEEDLVLLSQTDVKPDSDGNEVHLYEGHPVYIYEPDCDLDGNRDDLVADGIVERNTHGGWTAAAKWNCRIDHNGIRSASEVD